MIRKHIIFSHVTYKLQIISSKICLVVQIQIDTWSELFRLKEYFNCTYYLVLNLE